MIDIPAILNGAPDHVVMRVWSGFPSYVSPHDIDIVCGDMPLMEEFISKRVNAIRTSINPHQTHLDVIGEGGLDLKFDLYSLYISEKFVKDVLERRRLSSVYGVWVPWEPHNLASKYYEYRVAWKEKYKRYEYYKYILDEYISL